jgi:cyclopropane fatty-acyl-phospholipid synthase-like methyltransferase
MEKQTQKAMAAFFDARAERWDASTPRKEQLLQNLLSLSGLKPGMQVLDIGCGTGVITEKIAALTQNDVIGIDVSPAMIALAKKNHEHNPLVFFEVNDFLTLGERSPVDGIIAFDCYPHFTDRKAFKASLLRNLKHHGICAILFDDSRVAINACHNGMDPSLALPLKEPALEAEFFSPQFRIRTQHSDASSYILILEKN